MPGGTAPFPLSRNRVLCELWMFRYATSDRQRSPAVRKGSRGIPADSSGRCAVHRGNHRLRYGSAAVQVQAARAPVGTSGSAALRRDVAVRTRRCSGGVTGSTRSRVLIAGGLACGSQHTMAATARRLVHSDPAVDGDRDAAVDDRCPPPTRLGTVAERFRAAPAGVPPEHPVAVNSTVASMASRLDGKVP